MQSRVKTRPSGSIHKSLGRPIDVIPVETRRTTQRAPRISDGCGPGKVEADAMGDVKQNTRPPSGSTQNTRPPPGSTQNTRPPPGSTQSRVKAARSRPAAGTSQMSPSSRAPPNSSGTARYEDSCPVIGGSRISTGSRSAHVSPKMSRETSAKNDSSKIPQRSPVSSRSTLGSTRSSPGISSRTSTNSRPPSGGARKASGSARSTPTKHGPSPQQDPLEGDFDPSEQDVRFIDVASEGSRPASKARRATSATVQDNGRKPHRTIDPEEILAQNMEADFSKIYEISLHTHELTTIDNLEKFRKVRVLDLSCNFIELIQNLEYNRELRELKLYDNRIGKIEHLENLRDLSSLQLQHNKIKSIGKGLVNLKKLKNLRLDCNQLLRIESPEVTPCVQLAVLDISYNMLDSLAALNYLPNLEELNASGNRLRSVSDLNKCKQLQDIDLSRNRITDLSGLKGLPKLLVLNVSYNQLKSFKSLGKLKLLQDLHAGNNQIYELSPLVQKLPGLEVLDIPDNEISDWDEVYNLEDLGELVELFISGNPFCCDDGPMPHYHSAIQAVLPELEIIDGAHIKKHVAKTAPLMRPMSASTLVSIRQMHAAMRSASDQMSSMERSLEDKFSALRESCDTLPAESPRHRSYSSAESRGSTLLSSRCNSINRIRDAQAFAFSTQLD